MASQINTWEEYAARLEKELLNSIDSVSFMHSQVVRPDGTSVTFRSIEDLRSQLNMANTQAARARMSSGGLSIFFSEVAP